jgi:hypothetical protein
MREVILGLGNPPIPMYLYVGNGSKDGQAYHWYRFEDNQLIPVHKRALTGFVKKLKVTAKDYKGNDTPKLDILVSADQNYVIRSGLTTVFAKGFLLSMLNIEDYSKPLTIAVQPGEDTVVFCALYDAITGSRIKAEDWNMNINTLDVIKEINEQLC